MTDFDFIRSAKRVLDTEVQALVHLERYFDEQFEAVCRAIIEHKGKVIVMGIGKSGISVKRSLQHSPVQVHPLFLSTRVKLPMAIWYDRSS
ncbi:arabinose 5-phosphate isomerase [Vibrio maritimus]|uniref:Arabinose 5-phosphate isomerase n=1 Tax=Vibrio maritimus TaxID=990268 RepID=A0A090RV35_9VIBR|nr:arabinose 5-phosphate isomerase [Vibrio maritimus]